MTTVKNSPGSKHARKERNKLDPTVLASIIGAFSTILGTLIGALLGNGGVFVNILPGNPIVKVYAAQTARPTPTAATTGAGTPSVASSSPGPGPSSTSPGQPSPPPTTPPAATHSMRVVANTWIDYDGGSNPPPHGNAQNGVPIGADAQVGPDNIIAPNYSWLWVSNGTASCATQAIPGDAWEGQILLSQVLPPGIKSVLNICVKTNQRQRGLLAISSVNGDQHAPYIIKFTLYGTSAN